MMDRQALFEKISQLVSDCTHATEYLEGNPNRTRRLTLSDGGRVDSLAA